MINLRELMLNHELETVGKIQKAETREEVLNIVNNNAYVYKLLCEALLTQRDFLLKRIPYEVMSNVEKLMNVQCKIVIEENKNGPSQEFDHQIQLGIVAGLGEVM